MGIYTAKSDKGDSEAIDFRQHGIGKSGQEAPSNSITKLLPDFANTFPLYANMRVSNYISYGIALIVILSACSDELNNERQVMIFGDTLKVVINKYGDTLIREFTRIDGKQGENYIDTSIYSDKEIDASVPQSSFYFSTEIFRIYFHKQPVIGYCDSIIRNTPSTGGVNWHIVNSAERLKAQVQFDKPMSEQLAGWLVMLLERFQPLIIDTRTGQNAKKLMREKYLSKFRGYREYSAINQQGDTVLIDGEQDFYTFEIQD